MHLPNQAIFASAGSGKTKLLVDRIVQLIALGVFPSKICCITYTKVAAQEIRQRIELALGESAHLAKQINIGTIHAIWQQFLQNFNADYNDHLLIPNFTALIGKILHEQATLIAEQIQIISPYFSDIKSNSKILLRF